MNSEGDQNSNDENDPNNNDENDPNSNDKNDNVEVIIRFLSQKKFSIITSFIPKEARYWIFLCKIVWPFTIADALGWLSVKGFSRVPKPAASIIAFICYGCEYKMLSSVLKPFLFMNILFNVV